MKRFSIMLIIMFALTLSVVAQITSPIQNLPECGTSCLSIVRIDSEDNTFVYQYGSNTSIYEIDSVTNNVTQYDIGGYFVQRGYLLDFAPLANHKIIIAESIAAEIYLTLVDLQLAQSISLSQNTLGVISPCGQLTGNGMGEPRSIFLYDTNRVLLCSREANREAYFNIFRLENNNLFFEQKARFGAFGEVPTYPTNWLTLLHGLDGKIYVVPTANNSVLLAMLSDSVNSLDFDTFAVLNHSLTSQNWAGQIVDIPVSRSQLIVSNRVREINLAGVDEAGNMYFLEGIRNESLAVVASSLTKFSSTGQKIWELTEAELGGVFDNIIIRGIDNFSAFFIDGRFVNVRIPNIPSLSLLDSTSLPIAGHDPFIEGAVIDLGSVTASPLKFRANTNPATVGSVVFSLNGQVVGTSNTAPYDLNWTPLVGQHSLTATPYSGADGTGTAGSPYTVNFTVRQPRILYIHDGRIYSMNPDGTDSRALVTGGSPAWSPDGTRIAYWGNSATGREIFVMNADGSNKTRLTYNNADDRNPSWSPNGNRIVYDSVVAGSDREIYVMNADGTNPVNITNNSVDDFDPSWSPTGDWIAFSSQAGDEDQIFIMRTNGNNRTRLTVSENNLVSPNWSPDGTIIVYTKLGTNTDIYRINADGTGGFRLTDNAATDQSPGWSADGTKILFSSLREPGNNNYFELYWMNANGSGETRLTNTANVNEVAGVPAYP